MENIKQEQVVEAEFEEVTEEQVAAETQTEQEVKAVAEVRIQVLSNGGLAVNVPEGSQKLESAQIESIVKSVYDQLHEQRIAQQALELFKSKLQF